MIDEEEDTETQQTLPNLGSKQSLDHEYSSFKMNQLCKVCGEPAAGFHFGAFTCEGCKSFFGRTYSNLSQMGDCKNGGKCAINRKNRTSCKACRLRKCLMVGMSKSGSRYGRRSNWFKIHCLLQNQKEGGSSEHDQDGEDDDMEMEEGTSERTLSTPSSMKSRTISSPNMMMWNQPSMSPICSPTMASERDEKPDQIPQSPMTFMNPMFPGHPFLMHPSQFPMSQFPPSSTANREALVDLQQIHPEILRWYMACQPAMPLLPLPKMPHQTLGLPEFNTAKSGKSFSSPSGVSSRKRHSSGSSEVHLRHSQHDDQPLDLSAKRNRNASDGSRDSSYGSQGVSPQSPSSSSDDEEEDVDEHFRRSSAGMVLDLSRK